MQGIQRLYLSDGKLEGVYRDLAVIVIIRHQKTGENNKYRYARRAQDRKLGHSV